MKFPIVKFFSDNTHTIINSVEELQSDPDWAVAELQPDDVLVDSDKKFYRARSIDQVDEFTDGLADTVVFDEITITVDREKTILDYIGNKI